ncbi:hypothetical protein P8Q88_07880 [Qipengyuania sp. XHP0207]|uniref:hypothetical protein n=1 Tax=Qipengyuania sp. XHP0207 TaxID=3038078 RepID=UPI00241E0C58|nr:hypothetical protein [Qipengyuania sp. XHP0207]MDG5748098.1 hypothetical protein [Qipengyuania sp. XHP0207]
MKLRLYLLPFVALAAIPANVSAQSGSDERVDDTEYAASEMSDTEHAVPQIEIELDEPETGARRVIPARQDGTAPTFVQRPVVQPLNSVEPDRYASSGSTPAPVAYTGASSGSPRSMDTYVYRAGEEPVLPAGGRVVQFDRSAWLTECARRLTPPVDDTDDDENRPANDSLARCEAYLDGYLASAQSGGLRGTPSPTGDYMLVPVTVMQPRAARYSDGTPVRARD